MEDTIIIIDSIEEAEDNKGKTYLKITDKAGVTRNFKEGRSNLLTNKGHLLQEGVAIKLHFQDYKTPDGNVFPFVKDFESVKDEFVKQATEKVQGQAKDSRDDSIESQVAFKGMIELIATGMVKTGTREYNATLEWGMSRLHSVAQIVAKIEEVKGEITKSSKDSKVDNKSQDEGEGAGQDSNEVEPTEPKTVGEFLTWLTSNGIKAPRTWLEVEYNVGNKEVLTIERCCKLYVAIKKDKRW